MRHQELLSPREAAQALGISYPAIKQWIYRGKLKTVQTAGGHHRVPVREIERYLPRATEDEKERKRFRKTSGRNQLVGRIIDVRISGLLAQVKLSIGGQQITSIITADAAREMDLRKGQTAAALIKSTEVMIIRA
ncbi:MAG TPA: TOBE domain-containing protein [Candidatus Acidoferrales bacterium]|nr:TOBE domain-containing protein [Candidatus Acidoferrales bacterium]